MALAESPPKVLDQEYCPAGPQFGTVKLFNPNDLNSILIPTKSWVMPVTSLFKNREVPVSMSTLHFRRVERRRTTRVAVFADLTIQGFNESNEKFKIQTRSLSVSGHGGLTVLDAAVTVGQKLFLANEISKQKAECKVVSVRAGSDGKNLVAFEFTSPQPNFWKITFPASGTKPFRRSLPSTATA